jgi:hypothetical protein
MSVRYDFEEVLQKPIVDIPFDQDYFDLFKACYKDGRYLVDDAKLTEYYLSTRMLHFSGGIYLDIAAQDCPFAHFVSSFFGCDSFRQDLYYIEQGVHGKDIGGDACEKLPFEPGQVSYVTLHNSFEHFEDDRDTRLLQNMETIMKVGGIMIIVPFYVGDHYAEITDAGWVDEHGTKHLWGIGARFSRMYSAQSFKERVLDHSQLYFTMYSLIGGPLSPYYFLIAEKVK